MPGTLFALEKSKRAVRDLGRCRLAMARPILPICKRAIALGPRRPPLAIDEARPRWLCRSALGSEQERVKGTSWRRGIGRGKSYTKYRAISPIDARLCMRNSIPRRQDRDGEKCRGGQRTVLAHGACRAEWRWRRVGTRRGCLRPCVQPRALEGRGDPMPRIA